MAGLALWLSTAAVGVAQEALQTVFEQSEEKETATYAAGIAWWQRLAQAYEDVSIREVGMTDSGYPLHVVSIQLETEAEQEKTVVLINNAIHPGEPDGVEASMLLIRDLLQGEEGRALLAAVDVHVIPFYNIGGALNRNTGSRANQNGPVAYGFRGNAQNYDLNRDFIKTDSRNARSFQALFQELDPHVFVDTHVSNGADYQYVLTVLATQQNRLGSVQEQLLQEQLEPALYAALEEESVLATPYVNVFGTVPDSGWVQFNDGPRYSTGYASLFQTIGFMTETHMLKPFDQRVRATYAFLKALLGLSGTMGNKIRSARQQARADWPQRSQYPLGYEVDRSQPTLLKFKGYTARMVTSEVTGFERLQYDRSAPFEKEVPVYDHFVPSVEVEIPTNYAIPVGYRHLAEALSRNGIYFEVLDAPLWREAQVYYISEYETSTVAYEGHYPHYKTEVRTETEEVVLPAGSLLVPTGQPGIRYLMEVLEPQGADSFFNWNAFDAILQQKEHFSPYVFEEEAAALLAADAELRAAFDARKASDAKFAAKWYTQLDFIYKRSDHYEGNHLRYPVVRLFD